ncbi:MAG: pentapeptide repeat-containing protein [Fidelibacterota bacterium]
MNNNYFEDQQFSGLTDSDIAVQYNEFEQCTFNSCDFSGMNFKSAKFTDCQFRDCNLSMINLAGVTLNTIEFHNCKLTGVDFSLCNDFLLEVSFHQCLLNFANFVKLPMAKTLFRGCQLHEANFTQTDLSGAVFDECDLKNATFEQTNLTQADLSGAENYIINPEKNRIRNAKFALTGLPGLVAHYDIKIL